MITRRRFNQAAAAMALMRSGQVGAAATGPREKKKGCCFVARAGNGWRTRVEMLQPSWMYSWGRARPEDTPAGVEFVPMLWGDANEDRQQRRIDDLKQRATTGEVRHLLGFNEPDQHEQANMTVDRAVELWPDLMEVGVPLVSPGCVHPDRQWMKAFMKQVERRDLRVDAIAVHSYMGPSVRHLVRQLRTVYRMFERPIWITEFAVGDWDAKSPNQNRHSPERIARFLREVLPALDDLPFVHRYAWFSAKTTNAALGTSALFDEADELTELGDLYAAHAA